MYLIKGYTIVDKNSAPVEEVRFSGFSCLVLNNKKQIDEYRKKLTEETEKRLSMKTGISFLIIEIKGGTNESEVIKEYLSGRDTGEIAFLLSIEEDVVQKVISTYITNVRIDM